MTCGIYKITNHTNQKSYVGKSKNIEKRFEQHINHSTKFPSKFLWRDLNLETKDNFSFTILEECKREELQKRERYWIEKLNTIYPNGYNGNNGGERLSGFKMNKESEKQKHKKLKELYDTGKFKNPNKDHIVVHNDKTKKYILPEELLTYLNQGWKKGSGVHLYGEKNPMYGKHASKGENNKLSKLFLGSGNPFYGKHHSEETKRKISEGRKGEKNPCYNKIWITKGKENKRVLEKDLKAFLNKGWNKGRYISEETKRKQSESHKRRK